MKVPRDPAASGPVATVAWYRHALAVVLVGAVLALHPAPPRLSGAPLPAHALILSDQARRSLALQYRAFPTELMGCLIGDLHGSVVPVQRIAPADVDPTESTPTRVRLRRTCEEAGWVGTVGMIHNHRVGSAAFTISRGRKLRARTRNHSVYSHTRSTPSYAATALCGSTVPQQNGASHWWSVALRGRRTSRQGTGCARGPGCRCVESEDAVDEAFAPDYYLAVVAHGWRDADWTTLESWWRLRL